MNINELRGAIKRDEVQDLKFKPSDKDRLFKLFAEFLEKRDYQNGQNILKIFMSEKFFNLHNVEESSISEDDKQWNIIETQFNKAFEVHFTKLIQENDLQSFKKICKYERYWGNYWDSCEKRILLSYSFEKNYSLPVLSLPCVNDIPLLLLKSGKDEWLLEFLKQVPSPEYVSKFIDSHSKYISDEYLVRLIHIYVYLVNNLSYIDYHDYLSLKPIFQIILKRADHELLEYCIFNLEEKINSEYFEHPDNIMNSIFSDLADLNYGGLKKILLKYLHKKHQFTPTSLLMIIETIKKEDNKSLFSILNFLENITIDKKINREYKIILILLYAFFPERCSSNLISRLKLYDRRRKKNINNNIVFWDYVKNIFKDNTELLFIKLERLIKTKLLKSSITQDDILFYSEYIFSCLTENLKEFDFRNYLLIVAKYLYQVESENEIISQLREILAEAMDSGIGFFKGFFSSNSENKTIDESKKHLQFICIVYINHIFQGNLDNISSFEITIADFEQKYILKWGYPLIMKIHNKAELNMKLMSSEFKVKLLLNLRNAYNSIQLKTRTSIYDTIILSLINTMLKYYNNIITQEKIDEQVKHEKQLFEEREKEKDKIISNVSHSIKNLISTVIDPLTNLKEEQQYRDVVIDNALKGADLIREIVNAMNLSSVGSLKDFKYDARCSKSKDSVSLYEIIIEALKHSISNMFDSKYFGDFSRKYFSDKEIYQNAKAAWHDVSSLDSILEFINKFMFNFELNVNDTIDLYLGNEKGSAIKFQILFHEMILNAVKYVSFIDRKKREVVITFTKIDNQILFSVSNSYKKNIVTKTTGLGHIIIKNFAKLLKTKPEIKENSKYELSLKFFNFWEYKYSKK